MIAEGFMKVIDNRILGDWENDYKHGTGFEKFPN